MNKEKALKSKTFCSALWTAIYQSPNGSVSPCCVWRGTLGNVNNSSIDDIFNSEYVNGLKNKMLDGKKINQCKYCYDIENDTKSESTRHFFNKHFIDKIDWESSDSKFLYWDLRISNLCNFKCRMCSHGLSSEWYDDWKALGNDPQEKVVKIDDKSNFWKQLEEHYKYVDTIYFAGGEPFMNEHHYKILEDLVDRKLHDTKITVNTNASITHWKKKKVLDYYKPFNNVIFGFSIDGSYEVGEYIRKGLNYKEWKKNVKEYVDYISDKDTWDITYLFQFAYGVTNIHNICDFIIDLLNDGLITKYCQFQFQPIVNPIEQSVKSIPPSIFEKFKKDVSKMDNILEEYGLDERTIEPIIIHLKKIITYIESNPYNKTNLNQFYKKQEKLDKIRNESIYDIIPDYRKLPIDVDGK
jgi:MoaA/NifB/PqqE/SkfB family radical SAM enzyme